MPYTAHPPVPAGSLIHALGPVLQPIPGPLQPITIGGAVAGWVTQDGRSRLTRHPGPFQETEAGLCLDPALATAAERTAAVAAAFERLAADGDLPAPRGEAFPVLPHWGAPELMRIDRGYLPVLGVMAFGLHVNGYVVGPNGLRMWIATRAFDRMVEPGKLDNLIGGGQSAGLSLAENLVKEAAEEAGIPPETAVQARPVGLISYQWPHSLGVRRDIQFTFDLALDADFVPTNTDGEVAAFRCLPIAAVLDHLRADPSAFKFNVPPVILDFCLRHGVLHPDTEPEYTALAGALRTLVDRN